MRTMSVLTVIAVLLCIVLAAPGVRADFWDDDAYKNQPQQPQQQQQQGQKGKKAGNTLVVGVVVPAPAGSPTDLGWAPAEGVEVTVLNTEFRNLTDSNGMVRFDGMPDGNYVVIATKAGIGQQSRTITVKGPMPTQISIQLTPGASAFEEKVVIAPDTCYIAYAAALPSLPAGATTVGTPGASFPGSTTPGVTNPYGPQGPTGATAPVGNPYGNSMPGGGPVDTTRSTKGGLGAGADPFTMGGGFPQDAINTSTGNANPYSYMPNFGTNLNNLMLVDPQDPNHVGFISLSAKPYWLRFNAPGTKLYIAVEGQQIQVYDILNNNVLLGSITVPDGYVTDMALSPDGNWLYASIASITSPGVLAVNTSSNTIARFIPTQMTQGRQANPRALAMSPDGMRLYVALGNKTAGEVAAIDTYNQRYLASAEVGAEPLGMAVSPDGGKLYVSCSNVARVFVVGTHKLTVTKQINVGMKPMRCVVSPDGGRLYVCCNGSGGVAVVDARKDVLITSIATGAGAMDIAISSDGRKIYVTNNAAGTASLIDGESNMVVKSSQPIPNCKPFGVAVKP